MANNNTPFGFIPSIIAGDTDKYSTYTIASGYANNLCMGDPVKFGTSGVNGLPSIVIANPGDTLVGIFNGCEWTDYSGRVRRTNFWPAGVVATDVKAYVYDNPYLKFRVQLSGAYNDSMIGQNFDFVAGAGNYAAGSAYALDSTTAGSGTGFKLLQVFQGVDNEVGNNAVVEVEMLKNWIK